MKNSLVLVASEQLWPNLASVVHFIENQEVRISRVFIYYTADKFRSEFPAKRLEYIIKNLYKEIELIVPASPCGILPEDLVYQLKEWQNKYPSDKWILNASCGTKLLAFGAIELIGKDFFSVIYRELSTGTWYELFRNKNYEIKVCPIDIPNNLTDKIPVTLIVQASTYYSEFKNINWICRQPDPLPVVEITKNLVNGYRLRESFKMEGINTGMTREGFLLERYIAGVMQYIGISNLVLNMTQFSEIDEKGIQEIDIIANYSGRLYLVDCKLRENLYTSDAKETLQTAYSIGGSNTKCIFVRESSKINKRILDPKAIELFELNKDLPNIFTIFSDFFGIPHNPEWIEFKKETETKKERKKLTNKIKPKRKDLQKKSEPKKVTVKNKLEQGNKHINNKLSENTFKQKNNPTLQTQLSIKFYILLKPYASLTDLRAYLNNILSKHGKIIRAFQDNNLSDSFYVWMSINDSSPIADEYKKDQADELSDELVRTLLSKLLSANNDISAVTKCSHSFYCNFNYTDSDKCKNLFDLLKNKLKIPINFYQPNIKKNIITFECTASQLKPIYFSLQLLKPIDYSI